MEEGCSCLAVTVAGVLVLGVAYAAMPAAANVAAVFSAVTTSITGFLLGIVALAIVCAALGGGWFLAYAWLRSRRQRDAYQGRFEDDEVRRAREERAAQDLCDKLNAEGYETEPYYHPDNDEWLIRVFTVPSPAPRPKRTAKPRPPRSDLD